MLLLTDGKLMRFVAAPSFYSRAMFEAYVKELGECLLDALFAKNVCRSKLGDPFFYHASRRSLEGIRKEAEPQRVSKSVLAFVDQNHNSVDRFVAARN